MIQKRGRGAAGKVPVFGILEIDDIVRLEVGPKVSAQTLMPSGYRHLRVDHSKHFAQGKVHINGLEGFWRYAKERLAKFHRVSNSRFEFHGLCPWVNGSGGDGKMGGCSYGYLDTASIGQNTILFGFPSIAVAS